MLYDEIDTVFGPKAKDNEEIRGLLNAGHRRSGVAGRCVVRGKQVFTEEIPAYCAVALAGLGGLPDTILSRSVIVRMRRRAPNEQVEPFRRRVHEGAGDAIRHRLEAWAIKVQPEIGDTMASRSPPALLTAAPTISREASLAVADKLLGNAWLRAWPSRRFRLVAESKEHTPASACGCWKTCVTSSATAEHMATDGHPQGLVPDR